MITEKQIELAKSLVNTGIVNKVYHSVELLPDSDQKTLFPIYKIGTEAIYVGPDDTKEIYGYIRQNGPARAVQAQSIGGCSQSYNIFTPHRVVIFQDYFDGDFDATTYLLVNATFIKGVVLTGYENNAFKLAKSEAAVANITFGANTFYLAIDIIIKTFVSPKLCAPDQCVSYPNPICNEL